MTTTTAAPYDLPRRYTTCARCLHLVPVQAAVWVDGESWCGACWRAMGDEEAEA